MVWPTLGSRTAEDRTEQMLYVTYASHCWKRIDGRLGPCVTDMS